MKKALSLIATLLFTAWASAQTQQGYVKTLGRPDKAGEPLGGVSVRVKGGHNEVLSGSDGTFEMRMDGKKNGEAYALQSVQKAGYELNENDIIGRQFAFSDKVRLEIVMVSSSVLQAEKRRIEDNAYRTAERNYKAKATQIEQQLQDSAISIQQYRERMAELQDKFEKYQSLIDGLAEHYAHTDYDFLSETDREINICIENGELERADSLINTLFDPIGVLERNMNALARIEQQMSQAQGIISQANADMAAVLKQQEKDAEYLYQLYTIALGKFDYEKAGFYIKTRAALNSTNFSYLFDAAGFCEQQNEYAEAEAYYLEILSLIDILNLHYIIYTSERINNPQINNYYLKATLGLASVYSSTRNHTKSEELYLRALETIRPLANENPEIYNPQLSEILNNLAIVYFDIYHLEGTESVGEKCAALYLESLNITRQLAMDNPQAYESNLATTLNNLGNFYCIAKKYKESEAALIESLEIRRHLSAKDPSKYESDLASTLHNLGTLYKNTQRPKESESMFLESLEIYKRLATTNPKVYKLNVASVLYNLGILYYSSNRYQDCELVFLEALDIYRFLATGTPQLPEQSMSTVFYDNLVRGNSQSFKPQWATISHILASMYSNDLHHQSECESLYLEAAALYRTMAIDNHAYESELARILFELGGLYYRTQRLKESEAMYIEAAEFLRPMATDNPDSKTNLTTILLRIGSIRIKQNQLLEAIASFEEVIGMYSTDTAATIPGEYFNTLNGLSLLYIMTSQFDKAEQLLRSAASKYPSMQWINPNLSLTLLFHGKYIEAEQLCKNFNAEKKNIFLDMLFGLENYIPKERKADVERIRQMLNE